MLFYKAECPAMKKQDDEVHKAEMHILVIQYGWNNKKRDRIKNTYMRPLLIKKNCMHARIGDCNKSKFKEVGLDGLDTYMEHGKQHTYKVLQRS